MVRLRVALLFGLLLLASVTALPASTEAAARGQLVVALDSDLETMDPQQPPGSIDYSVLMHMFDHLVAHDPQTMKVTPNLAESWRLVDDHTWEFRIRRNVKFHNGEPLNAEAVKFSIERVLNPAQKSFLRARFMSITQVQVTDEFGISLKTARPDPVLLERLTNLAIMPPKYVKEKGDAFVAKNPVGTGPYRFIEWQRGQRLVMEANPGYWGPEPAIKTLVFRTILDVGTAIAEMLAGSVDFIRLVPPDQVPLIEASGKAYIASSPIIRIVYLSFDTIGRAAPSPLQNIKVRQAIMHAVDVDAIIKYVLGGRALRINTPVNPFQFGYDESIKPIQYDPARSKQLLAEAGYPNGLKIEFLTYAGSIIAARQVGDAVAGYLAKVGIETNRQHLEDLGLFSNIERVGKIRDVYLASHGSWSVFDADMMLYPRFYSKEGLAYVREPKLDEWLDGARFSMDPKKRMELYSQVQHFLIDNALVFPLYAQVSNTAVTNRINYKASPDELLALWRATWKN